MKKGLSHTIFRSRFFPYIIIFILPFVFFYQAIIGGKVIALGDFTGSDLLELHLPFKYIIADAYRHGEFPLWASTLSLGFPVLAEGQSGALYPITILLSFLPPYLSLNLSLLIALSIAGLGTYIYLNSLKIVGRYGAIFASVIFMFSSFFIARIKHLNMITVASFLPLCLWCVHQAYSDFHSDKKSIPQVKLVWFVYLAVFWMLQLLAGHPHIFFLSAIMCAWSLIGEGLYVSIKYPSKRIIAFVYALVGLIVASIIALCLSAAQILPTIELTRLSSRVDFTFQTATAFPLKIEYLASLFAPFFLGNPATATYSPDIINHGIWWENVTYIGLIPLMMLVYAIITIFRKLLQKNISTPIRKRIVLIDYRSYTLLFYFFTAILFYLFAMGSGTPLFGFLYTNFPGFELFRFPNRFLLFTIFSLCIIVGITIEKICALLEQNRSIADSKKDESSDYVFSWPFSNTVTQFIFILFVLIDLRVFALQYISFFTIADYLAKPEVVSLLSKEKKHSYRIYQTTQYADQNPFRDIGWKKGESAINFLQKALPGNFPAVYGIDSFTDRGWFEGGLGVKDRFTLEKFLLNNELPADKSARIYGLWNIRYLLGYYDIDSPLLQKVGSYTDSTKSFAVPITLYENSAVMPRAFIVEHVNLVDSASVLLKNLVTNDESLYRSADIIREAGNPLPTESLLASASGFIESEFTSQNSVQIVAYENQHVVMKASTDSQRMLVFSDIFYPGWKAYVDGVSSPVYRVNFIQRGVVLPRGEHTIVWSYEPIVFYIGLGTSLATIVTLTTYFLIRHARKGRRT